MDIFWNRTFLVANLATNFQDLAAKVENLVALAPVLGAISRPAIMTVIENMLKTAVEISMDNLNPSCVMSTTSKHRHVPGACYACKSYLF